MNYDFEENDRHFKEIAHHAFESQARQIDHEVLMYLLKGYSSEQIFVRHWPEEEKNGKILLRADVGVVGEPKIAGLVELIKTTGKRK